MALQEYKSECEKYQKEIVFKDKGNPQQYIVHNKNRNEVYQYRIDGYVITEGERCDGLLWNETKGDVYLVELKGSDPCKAVSQLLTTEVVLKNRYKELMKGMCIYYRVVMNKVPVHSLDKNEVRRFKIAHPGRYIIKTGIIEDNI